MNVKRLILAVAAVIVLVVCVVVALVWPKANTLIDDPAGHFLDD